jgi:hypothetical protein
MKKLLGISSFLFLIILTSLQTGVTSCTKDKTIYDTVTVIKKDTLVIQDTAISLQLLAANSWKVQEIRGVQNNSVVYYQRGGTTNTESFDNEYITFNTDKTGIYYDNAGYTHQMTWDFSNNVNTKLTIVIQNPAPLANQTVVYENLRYKNKTLLFDQYWTYNNTNAHAQVIRIPR